MTGQPDRDSRFAVACPHCGARPSERCVTRTLGIALRPHKSRTIPFTPADTARPSWSDKASKLATRPADGYRAAVNDHCASVRDAAKAFRNYGADRRHLVTSVVAEATALATGPVARQVPADLDAAWEAYRAEFERQFAFSMRNFRPRSVMGIPGPVETAERERAERLRRHFGERARG